MASIFENGHFRELTEEECCPEPNNWYCAECGIEFAAEEWPCNEIICPQCKKVLYR